MLDLAHDIRSLGDVKRSTVDLLDRLRKIRRGARLGPVPDELKGE